MFSDSQQFRFVGLLATLLALVTGCEGPGGDGPAVPSDGSGGGSNPLPLEYKISSCSPPPGEIALMTPPFNQAAARCPGFNELRNAYFGDMHVHTSWSFDAWIFGNDRNDPQAAIDYARGAKIRLNDGPDGPRYSQLSTPLDFVAVTDHAEYLGETELCTNPEVDPDVYNGPECQNMRGERNVPSLNAFTIWGLRLTAPAFGRHTFCNTEDCLGVARSQWEELARVNEANYDACQFTTFNAYEYSAADNNSRMHRNIIYANATIPALPVTYFEEPTPEGLARRLLETCRTGDGCQQVVIPHNSNLSHGRLLFVDPLRFVDPAYVQSLAQIATLNRLLEITQAKGTMECRLGLGSTDEECAFEDFDTSKPLCCDSANGVTQNCVDAAANPECKRACPGDRQELLPQEDQRAGCTATHDYFRGALRKGIKAQESLGFNPLKLGAIGSTDNHQAMSGGVDESGGPASDMWQGSQANDNSASTLLRTGNRDQGATGIAGVWAEQNTRESIFAALHRRETFATSGPRIKLRFFAGDYPADLCRQPPKAMLSKAYASGVPMGQDLPAAFKQGDSPDFLVVAQADAHPLQQVQVVKVWADASGEQQERIFHLANFDAGTTVAADCAVNHAKPEARRFSICELWNDPEYSPAENASYYARVIEQPSCRWTGHLCAKMEKSGVVNCATDAAHACCAGHAGSVPRTLQERAWSSPIWTDASCAAGG